MSNPFRDWYTKSLELGLVALKQEVEDARLTLRITPGEINLMIAELESRKERKETNDIQ